MGAPTRRRHGAPGAARPPAAAHPGVLATPEFSTAAAWALGAALIALLILRLLAELRTDALFWGLDYARFLAPALRYGPWVAALLAVALATQAPVRTAARGLGQVGGGHALAALVCGALCIAFPDLILFTGDFALRRSAIAGITNFDNLFPQATQLDRFVHLVIPRTLLTATGLSVETVASATGVIEAMILGALSVEFARRCGARGLAAVMAVCVVAGSGAIGLFTGYDKALAEMCIVTLAFGVAGFGEIARGRIGWASGLLVVLGLAFHRSGLALLPAWIVLWVMLRKTAAPGPKGWPWARLVPAALLLALIPSTLSTSSTVDARHLAPHGLASMLTEAFAPRRLLALANLAVFLVPLVPLLPVAYMVSRPGRDRGLHWLAVLAVCWLVPCFFIHPVQGEFRDWDDFAAAGVATALPLAWLLARSPARTVAPLAIALAAAAAVPRIQFLALQSSQERALARIESWAMAPYHSPRSTSVAAALEHVGMVHFQQGRNADARRALKASLDRASWTRVMLEWANAEAQQGDWILAQSLYEQAARQTPNDPGVWTFLAQGAFRHADRNAATRAAEGLRRISPSDPRIGQIEAGIRAMPISPVEVRPDSS